LGERLLRSGALPELIALLGRSGERLQALPRDRIVLPISLDRATPDPHELHRGPSPWTRTRAREGIQRARAHGFRVQLAATASTDAGAEEFRQFLDEEKIAAERPFICRIALRGSVTEGVARRADIVPEVTLTAEGVYWHPVGAEMPICWSRATFSAVRVLRRGPPRP
jgi:hypothetical protein